MVAFTEGELFLKSATFAWLMREVLDGLNTSRSGGSHHGLEIAYRIGDQLADSQSNTSSPKRSPSSGAR